MNRPQDLADENYWNHSKQIGYSFDDDNGFVVVNDLNKYSGIQESGAFEDIDFQGFDELAGKKSFTSDVENTSLTITETASAVIQKQLGSLILELKTPEEKDICSYSPGETAKNLFIGQPYFFEQFKSYDKKIILLDSAIKLHDGNGITAAILFLEKTLKPSLFYQILKDRPVAVSHYLTYLKMLQKHVELTDMLVMLQKSEEAAMIQYKSAIFVQQTEQKIKNLHKCWKNHLDGDQNLSLYSNSVKEYIHLLERQLPIEEEDLRQEREMKTPTFQNLPRTASLLNMPVVTTLYYCCLYHYNLPENHLASPKAIKKYFGLSNKQFVWTALAALAKRQMWVEIDNLFQSKSWLGGMKLSCCIGFDKAVELLHDHHAPTEIIIKYLRLVDNIEIRLELAKKYNCEQLAVDTLVSMNDRQGLEKYKEKLVPHSKAYEYVQEALRSSIIKWKN
ncbi:spermatogenesis-defective protein 39 homolog [Centruroides sculpturatus]|uniref:spermatogenesis-defective protein 39 homolog n=1 Tax=Centruroides sculpturatus TaxID=218467 RepID=UPI000C6ECADD|nr:spermatogenesis-defective protein 39 homolog [Centruroides sculpturatus]